MKKAPQHETCTTKSANFTLVLPIGTLLLCAACFAFSSERTYRDPEGYTLLSIMIENEAKDWKAHDLQVKDLQIYNRNIKEFPCRSIPEEFRAAAEGLTKTPDGHFRFARKFKLRSSYSLNGSGDIRITAVGFDAARTHAIAYIDRSCGAMCSGGFTYLFRKNNQAWEIVDRVCETMS